MKNKIIWFARIGLIVLVIVSLFVLAACEEKEVDAPSVSLIETVDSEPKTEGLSLIHIFFV